MNEERVIRWWRIQDSSPEPSHMLPMPAETYWDQASADKALQRWLRTAEETAGYNLPLDPKSQAPPLPKPAVFAHEVTGTARPPGEPPVFAYRINGQQYNFTIGELPADVQGPVRKMIQEMS